MAWVKRVRLTLRSIPSIGSDLLAAAEMRSLEAAGACYAWENVPAEVRDLFSDLIPHEEKLSFMRMAIEEAWRSPFHPTVGAVIVRDGRVLAKGFRDAVEVDGTDQPRALRSRHAEEAALLTARDSLAGATLYTTLEPCFDRSMVPLVADLEACAMRIARIGIRTVVIGLIDQDPRTRGRGAQHLAANGVSLEFAYRGLEPELYRLIGNGRFSHCKPPIRHGLRRLLSSLRSQPHRRVSP